MPRLLLVDDDREMTRMLAEYLSMESFDVDVAASGPEGMSKVSAGGVDLMVLDVMLPGMSGFQVLRSVREESDLPVIMLTGRGEAVDRVVGLQIGADDYLPKPFIPQELVARIQAVLRRSQRTSAPAARNQRKTTLAAGDVAIDQQAHTARKDGEILDLTAAEFSLLRILLRYAGEVVTREELYREVLGREYSAYDRSLDNHVSSLRRKLGPAQGGTERIRALRGTGYVYCVVSRDQEVEEVRHA